MNNANLIIGNLCSFIAMIADSVGSTRKSAKSMLLFQTVGQFIYATGTFILKGYSGAVQNLVSILRNILAIKKIENKYAEWGLAALGVVLGLSFNNMGLLGVFPVVANLQYTIAVFRFKDNEKALKVSFLICILLFACFNVAILNFVGVASNAVVFITTALSLLKSRK